MTDPTIKWTYFDKESDPQEMFYMKLTYVDTGETIMEVTYPGSETSFILGEETIEESRKVKVMAEFILKELGLQTVYYLLYS